MFWVQLMAGVEAIASECLCFAAGEEGAQQPGALDVAR